MRLLLILLTLFSFHQAFGTDKGTAHVYLFRGAELPKLEKIYIKGKDDKKPIKEKVYMGFLEKSFSPGVYLFSTKRKGPFESVKIVSSKISQISFDLDRENRFVSKYDSFASDIKIDKKNFKKFTGKVFSGETGAPIEGATVFLTGMNSSVKTNKKGKFSIKTPVDQEFSLSVVHRDFRIKNKETRYGAEDFQVKLLPSMGELSEFVVLAPKTKGSIEDLLKERRKTNAVSVSIGSEQFKKSGDSNAANALKRVSGLSLVEGKYVYVRGLGERYSSTTLNGAMLPSPNPSRRVVPLDLFPTSLIESILIQKSYSVDKPAQFSAGLVEIRTLSIPKRKSFFKVSFSTGASSESILKGDEVGLKYEGGGDSDLLGIDDGTRALPEEIRNLRLSGLELKPLDPWEEEAGGFNEEEYALFGNSFSNTYNTTEDQIGLNRGVSFEGGRSFKMGSSKAGFVLKGLYGNTNDQDTDIRRKYELGEAEKLNLASESRIIESSSRYNLGGVFSTGLDLFKRSKLEYTGLVTRSTSNKVEKVFKETIGNPEESFETTRLDWEERELLTTQVKGEHHLFENYKGPKLEWFWAKSKSSRYRPDGREYKYGLEDGVFLDRGEGNQRIFADMNDEAEDFNFKVSGDIKPLKWLNFNLSAGSRVFSKSRISSTQRFSFNREGEGTEYSLKSDLEGILTEDNITNGEFRLRDVTSDTDSYTADEKNTASFASLTSKFIFSEQSSFDLISGVRYEDHLQTVGTFNIIDGELSPDRNELSQKQHFYNFGAVYTANEKLKLRTGYSETVVRPDLQEFSSLVFFNDDENIIEEGNPDLKIAEVQNLDLRLDYHFNKGEFLSFGIFRKDIKNPIEAVAVIGLDERIRPENIESALNDGLEIEFRKHLLKGLFVSGNYSYIKSKVEISEENSGAATNLERPLQGQSPYLVNLGVDYKIKKINLNTSLVYNVAGKRISQVGSFKSPDIYEESFHQLDFTMNKKISKNLSVSFKAQNILNPLAERTQGGESVRAIKYGRRYSINLSTSI